jgi:hypothetical protein
MTIKETLKHPEIQKIKRILCKINTNFHNAEPNIGELKANGYEFEWKRNKDSSAPISRREYIDTHPEIQNPFDFSFSLAADDIIAQKIPMGVMGCTGVAKLFAKYAKEENLDCSVVFTAKINDLEEKKKDKNAVISGHQIIAVQFSDGVRMFDPANPNGLQFYKEANGQEIQVPSMKHLIGKKLVSQNSNDPWAQRQAGTIITSIENSSKLASIKTYKDVENHYLTNEFLQQMKKMQITNNK